MLEIPLYDMHLPLSDHRASIEELLGIIERQKWQEINIDDLFLYKEGDEICLAERRKRVSKVVALWSI